MNTVTFTDGRTVGHNTDQPAFMQSLGEGLPNAHRRNVVVLGAGGAGAAAASAVLQLGTARLTIFDTEPSRAHRLAESLALQSPSGIIRVVEPPDSAEAMAGADGLIHATPTGMTHHPGIPFDLRLLRKRTWVAEIVYRPLNTELLRHARQLGCRTLDGGGMAVNQAALSFALFTGLEPNRERMRKEFDVMVQAESQAGPSG